MQHHIELHRMSVATKVRVKYCTLQPKPNSKKVLKTIAIDFALVYIRLGSCELRFFDPDLKVR